MKNVQYFVFDLHGVLIVMLLFCLHYSNYPMCVRVIADRCLHKAGLLNQFRSAHDPFIYEIIPEPTRLGLDNVTLSTSEQLTEKEFISLRNRLSNPAKIMVLDIRLLSDVHGFINGEPVQFYEANGSEILSVSDYINDVLKQFFSYKTVYMTDRHVRGMQENGIVMGIESINAEPDFVRSLGYEYKRMPLHHAAIIQSGFVDDFIKLVETKMPHVWIHIHDHDGLMGPSLLFVMADIIKNASKIPFEDILLRHVAFGGIDFLQKRYAERYTFLKLFYQYNLEKHTAGKSTWSDWLKSHNQNAYL